MSKEIIDHTPGCWASCPFLTFSQQCHARPDRVCKCNPDPRKSWPRRCPLKDHDIIVRR